MPREHDPLDAHIGERLRQLRILRGYSQTALADALGLSFQQVQKYEKGTNRVTAAKLYRIAQVLEVSMDAFFEDPAEGRELPESRAALKFAHLWSNVPDKAKDPLMSLIRSVAKAPGDKEAVE